MSKMVKIPECMSPFRVTVNNREYSYPAGQTVEVPDEVAEVITNHNTIHDVKTAPGGIMGGADWNAAEGEPGHVQNRTHWAVPGNLEYVPECQPQYDEENGTFLALSNVTVPEVGAECIVTWNGTDYPCTAQESPDMGSDVVFLGNGAPFGLPETQDPFAIAIGVEDGTTLCMALPLDGTNALTLAVRGPGEVIHTLDPKYLDKPWLAQQMQQVLIPAQQALKEELSSEMQSYVDSRVPYVDLTPYVSEIAWEEGAVKYHTALLSDEHANLLRYYDTVKIRYRMAGTYNYPETVLIHPIKNGTTRSRASFLETGHATDTVYAGGIEAVLVELEVGQNNYLKIYTSTHKLN